jgi:hypothetical protein
VRLTSEVPGAPAPAGNAYDVGQAMAWVSTGTNDLVRRERMQFETPALIRRLLLRN